MQPSRPVYVGFGMLTPVTIMVVNQLPDHNMGTLVKEVSEFVFDNAAIIAFLLRQWDIPTGMIGSTVGDDPCGHLLAKQLIDWGVQRKVRHSRSIRTPCSGIKTVLITMAEKGCLVVQGSQTIRIHAPMVQAVDGCGAGATFSAGFIYGFFERMGFGNVRSLCDRSRFP